MSDKGAEAIAAALFFGLMLNGCMQMGSINTHDTVDERELAEGMAKMACFAAGRNWKYGTCQEASQ